MAKNELMETALRPDEYQAVIKRAQAARAAWRVEYETAMAGAHELAAAVGEVETELDDLKERVARFEKTAAGMSDTEFLAGLDRIRLLEAKLGPTRRAAAVRRSQADEVGRSWVTRHRAFQGELAKMLRADLEALEREWSGRLNDALNS